MFIFKIFSKKKNSSPEHLYRSTLASAAKLVDFQFYLVYDGIDSIATDITELQFTRGYLLGFFAKTIEISLDLPSDEEEGVAMQFVAHSFLLAREPDDESVRNYVMKSFEYISEDEGDGGGLDGFIAGEEDYTDFVSGKIVGPMNLARHLRLYTQ